MSENKPTLLLIDGSNLAFRMYFALEMSNLRDLEGNPTWAVYGTLKALFDTIEFAKPSAAAVAFDLPHPTYRHEMFTEYKANRPDEMPDDMKPQWSVIKESFRKLHVPVLEEPGYEADDLIGIMAKKAEREGYHVVILSGDKDLFQLINENIEMAVPQRGGGLEIFTPEHVIEKMGVKPVQVPDYKGIAGDSSDNIPGVRGLGPKAAVKLLDEFGSLENIYVNIDKVMPLKMKEKLVEQEDKARLSKFIATIITDETGVKTADLTLSHCNLDMPDTDELISFLKKLEFNSILKRLPIILKPFNNGNIAKIDVGDLPESSSPSAFNTSPKKFVPKAPGQILNANKWDTDLDKEIKNIEIKPFVVLDEMILDSFVAKLKQVSSYAIDLETTGLNTLSCEIAGFAFAFTENNDLRSFYIPTKHQNIKHLSLELVLSKLKPIIEDSSKLQIIQNAKFEQKIFHRVGIKNHNNFFDTMLASYIDNSANKHGLKAQSKRIFNLRMQEIDELIGTGHKQITIDFAPIQDVAAYASADAYVCYKLYQHYSTKLEARELELLKNIEFPLVAVLRDIELAGISIDTEFLRKLSQQLREKLNTLETNIYEICGVNFNIASPKQLSDVLFKEMQLPTVAKKNKSGGYSTDIDTLEALLLEPKLSLKQKELVENIVNYRTLSKLTSTYVDNLPGLIAKKANKKSIVDSNGDFSKFKGAYSLTPNQPDLEKLIKREIRDEADLAISALELIQILEIEELLVTRGAKGMALISNQKTTNFIPALNLSEVFDVTGAGDTVAATYSLGLAAGATSFEAALLGNLAASIVVRKYGTATVSQDELIELIEVSPQLANASDKL